MPINVLSPQVSVSGQIQIADLNALADQGVEIVVCNRPDNEDHPQPLFADIAEAAKALSIEAYHIPFSGAYFTAEHVAEFKSLLASGKKIHAYCRSGNRSSLLWEAATNA